MFTPSNLKSVAITTVLVIGSAVLGFVHFLPWLNALLLPIFALGLYLIANHKSTYKTIDISLWLVTLLLGFFIAVYRPSDFHYPLIWQSEQLFEGGKSFLLYVNLSKGLSGYLVLIWLLNIYPSSNQTTAKMAVIATLLAVIAILSIAYIFFGIAWQPKFLDGLIYFIIVNLCITVVAEEAFFRLLLQQHLASFFSQARLGLYIGVSVSTILFALAHGVSSGSAMLLFLFAGAVYSIVYAYTRRLSVAIATHFGVNILHFILLEYPLSI